MRNYLIAGFLLLTIVVAGCSSPSGSGTGSGEEKLVEITQEEWDAQSEAESYCRALSDLDMLDINEHSKCVENQIGSDLSGKIDKWLEQVPLRSEIQRQKDAEEQREIEKNYNLSIGMTAVIPSFNREITLVSIDVPKDNSGLLAKVKIRNLGKLPLTVTFDDEFGAVDFDGNYYRASNPVPVKTNSVWGAAKMTATVQPDEEVTNDVLFKLDPQKVTLRVEHIEYKVNGKVLATWI